MPGKEKTEGVFGVGGGATADVSVVAGFCQGGGAQGRDSGGKEIFIKLQKKHMVAMEGKAHPGQLWWEQD